MKGRFIFHSKWWIFTNKFIIWVLLAVFFKNMAPTFNTESETCYGYGAVAIANNDAKTNNVKRKTEAGGRYYLMYLL